MVAVDEPRSVRETMNGTVGEAIRCESRTHGAKDYIMCDPPQRDDNPHVGQGCKLGLEEWSARGYLAWERLVLRRQAFDAVEDDDSAELQPIVGVRLILALAKPKSRERRKQQIAGIIAGERPPCPVCTMLPRGKSCNGKPAIRVAEGVDRRIPPVGLLEAESLAQGGEPWAARAIAWWLGVRKRAGNLHAAAIGGVA